MKNIWYCATLLGLWAAPGSAQAPSINAGGIVNAANYAHSVAAGSIAAVFGSFPGAGPTVASMLPLPDSLDGISFQLNGALRPPIPVFFVSSGQADIQVPWELDGQSVVSISVASNGQVSFAPAVSISPFSPGIFTTNASGTGQGAILNAQYQLVDSLHAATAGDIIQIYCTGLGPVTNQPATGYAALPDPLSVTTTMPSATIGGVQAPVIFSGLAPGNVGLYQINLQVPTGTGGGDAVPIAVSIGGITSNTVTISVQAPTLPGLTGTWTGSWGSTVVPGSNGLASATLTQAGTSVTGSISLDSGCFLGGPLSGTIAGTTITATITISGAQLATLSGIVDSTGDTINGSYGVSSGTCVGDAGLFILKRPSPGLTITPRTPIVGAPR